MTDVRTFIDKGVQHAQRAIELDRKACAGSEPEPYDGAKNSYLRAIEYYYTALKYEKNDRTKKVLRDKIKAYVERAEVMQKWLNDYRLNNPSSSSAGASSSTAPSGGSSSSSAVSKPKTEEKEESDTDKEVERLRSQLGSAILTEKPDVHWDDVVGLEAAKDALKEAVILPKKFPQVFVGKRKPWRGILLYGPPGTGKSHLARALAAEADCSFFSVSSSDLVSKWQGESERLVGQLFAMARASGNAIIFIDEIDALVSSRSDGESESSRRIKTEFLVQMDGVGKSGTDDGVLLLGATNIPWGLDDALLRRMERRVYIPLPDEEARAAMLQLHLGTTPHNLVEEHFKRLAARANGYSGSDIAIVVRDAIMEPVRKLQTAKYFKSQGVTEKNEDGAEVHMVKFMPCAADDPAARKMTLMELESDELIVPQVSVEDFEAALSKTKPSVGMDTIAEHEKFTTEKGQSGV